MLIRPSLLLADAKALIVQSRDPFYVYVIGSADGSPFYVGMGKGERICAHERAARGGRRRKDELIRNTVDVRYQVVFFADRRQAQSAEIELIYRLGRADLGWGPLLNLTDGGEGTCGSRVGASTRNKMSAAQKAALASPEARAARSEQIRLRWQQPGYREKIAAAMKRKVLGADAIARIDAAKRNRYVTESTRRKLSEKAAARRHSEATRRKLSLVQHGKKLSPEHKAKIAAGLRGHKMSDETRARLSAAAVRQHARARDLTLS